jgi:hypothetical protein
MPPKQFETQKLAGKSGLWVEANQMNPDGESNGAGAGSWIKRLDFIGRAI